MRSRKEITASAALVAALWIGGVFSSEIAAITWLRPLMLAAAAACSVYFVSTLVPDRLLAKVRHMWITSMVVGLGAGVAAGLTHWWSTKEPPGPGSPSEPPLPAPQSPPKPTAEPTAPTPAPRPQTPAARLSTELVRDETDSSEDVYLVVRNTGSVPVEAWASLTITKVEQFRGAREGQFYRGYWEAARGPNVMLAPAQMDRLLLGRVRQSPDTSKIYTITYYKDGARDSASDVWEFAGGDLVSHGPRLGLRLTLESYPPMTPARLTRAFQISSGGWRAIPLKGDPLYGY